MLISTVVWARTSTWGALIVLLILSHSGDNINKSWLSDNLPRLMEWRRTMSIKIEGQKNICWRLSIVSRHTGSLHWLQTCCTWFVHFLHALIASFPGLFWLNANSCVGTWKGGCVVHLHAFFNVASSQATSRFYLAAVKKIFSPKLQDKVAWGWGYS